MLVIAAQAATVPTVPTISVVAVTGNTVTLGLVTPSTETVFGVLGYDIYKSSNGFLYDKIATVVDLPYIAPGLSSGVSYQFIARGVSAAPGSYRSGPSAAVVGTTTGGVITPTRRIFRGWFVALQEGQMNTPLPDAGYVGIPNGGTVTGTYPTNVATGALVSNAGPVASGVNALVIRYEWKELDNGDGTFNFTRPDKEIAQCRALGVGLYMLIVVRTFNGLTADKNPLPPDLVTFAETFSTSSDGWQTWRWSPTVLQRFQQLCNAIGARYDLDPNFAGIATQETSTGNVNGRTPNAGNYTVSLGALGNYVGTDTYSSAGFTTALQTEIKIVGTACPNSRGLHYNNFIQGDSVAQLLVDALSIAIIAQTYGAIWAGPDLVTDLEPGNINGRCYPTYQKYHNGSNGILHPGLTGCSIQNAEWTGGSPGQTPVVAVPPGPRNPSLYDLFNWATASNTYPTSSTSGARDHRSISASPSPLNLDVIIGDWHTVANANGDKFNTTAVGTYGLVQIMAQHPTLGTVTPNP